MLLVETVGFLLGAHVVLNVAGEGVLLLDKDPKTADHKANVALDVSILLPLQSLLQWSSVAVS